MALWHKYSYAEGVHIPAWFNMPHHLSALVGTWYVRHDGGVLVYRGLIGGKWRLRLTGLEVSYPESYSSLDLALRAGGAL